MRIYLKNIPAELHPDPIWNDGALDFLKTVAPTRTRTRGVANDMGSVPDPEKLIDPLKTKNVHV